MRPGGAHVEGSGEGDGWPIAVQPGGSLRSSLWPDKLIQIFNGRNAPLIFLLFFFSPWYFQPVTAGMIVAACIALPLFLLCYFAPAISGPRALPWAILCVLGIAIAVSPFGAWWNLVIFAGAMSAEFRPAARAFRWLLLCIIVCALWCLWLETPWLYCAMAVGMTAMIGGGAISSVALKASHAELKAAQDQVRMLAEANERERIARDLHDTIGRSLTLVALKADLAERLLDREAGAARAEILAIGSAAREGLAEVRSALYTMTGASLTREVRNAVALLDHAGVETRIVGEASQIPGQVGSVLAMALREGATNIARHAKASTAMITLTLSEQHPNGPFAAIMFRKRKRDQSAHLTIVDDGTGGTITPGGGLSGMQARVAAAGGQMTVRSDRQGTVIHVALPTA